MESRIGRILGICLVLCAFVLSCSKQPPPRPGPPTPPVPGLKSQKPYQIRGIWYYPLPSAEGFVEEGIASWYGSDFHGKPTACGEPYDMWAMTAAHKTLPLGTYVKVTNLQNQRTIVLRINDRGPFVGGRVIDLSCKAAQELGSYGKGTAPVRVEAVQVASEMKVGQETYWKVDPVPSFRYGRFTVQIGAFRDQANALRLRDRMSGSMEARVSPGFDKGGTLYRVQVGNYQDIMVAKQETERMKSKGFTDAFVLAVEGK
ncbi:MAG: septal ring lytic transglycosylase RlpA family protein [Syntrophobacter sp.]